MKLHRESTWINYQTLHKNSSKIARNTRCTCTINDASNQSGFRRPKKFEEQLYKIVISKWEYVRRVCEIKAWASVSSRKMSGAKDFSCIGGLEKHIRVVKETVLFPLMYGDIYAKFNLKPPRGLLFYGPPGKIKRSTVRNETGPCWKRDSLLTFSASQAQEKLW